MDIEKTNLINYIRSNGILLDTYGNSEEKNNFPFLIDINLIPELWNLISKNKITICNHEDEFKFNIGEKTYRVIPATQKEIQIDLLVKHGIAAMIDMDNFTNQFKLQEKIDTKNYMKLSKEISKLIKDII